MKPVWVRNTIEKFLVLWVVRDLASWHLNLSLLAFHIFDR